tara:strand:- start:15340 stop:16476 length:1137 start_codon:yes stop_codon:yes gene_type:complete
MTAKLSKSDVQRLLSDPSADARADAAAKIATHYDAQSDFGEQEKKLAEEIFSLMCQDAEERVRLALADNLKECAFLPNDIARTLANDVAAVSDPILKYSSVLTDDDLIEIVKSQGVEKQKAIAARKSVSANVSDALIDTNNEVVVGTLVANNGAEISTNSMQRVLDDFADSELVKSSMVRRSSLPMEVSERLVNMVSEKLQQELLARHELPTDQISDLILQSREKATLGLMKDGDKKQDSRRLIVHLYQNNRLTPTIMLRALCMGDMEFFEGSVAVRSRIPLSSTREMIHAGDRSQITSILEKAELPKALQPAFTAAIEVADDTDYDGGADDQERFRRRMIERIITNFDDPDSAMGDDNIEYLLAQLTQIDAGFSTSY